MLRKLLPRSIYDVMAAIACFGVLAGGTAYAANTVFSSDIVDGEVKAPDIAANAVDSPRVRDNTINTFDVHSFLGADVVDNTLTGADINEGTLGQVPSAANGGRRITYDDPPSADIKTVLTIREMTLRADCAADFEGTVLSLYVDSTTPAVVNYGLLRRASASGDATPFADGGPTNFGAILTRTDGGAAYSRAEGQLVYSNANREISVTFHGIANNATGRCQLNGTAVPAPG